jgi:hypothetical protein
LAQEYYGTPNITPEQYDASKARTFAIMYGKTEDAGNVEFFRKVKEYINHVYKGYLSQGYILSGSGKRIVVEDSNPAKVFNYYIQCLETEVALDRISRIIDITRGSLTKPILYTYDAILLDLHRSDTALIPLMKDALESRGFPVRIYTGHDYNSLISH